MVQRIGCNRQLSAVGSEPLVWAQARDRQVRLLGQIPAAGRATPPAFGTTPSPPCRADSSRNPACYPTAMAARSSPVGPATRFSAGPPEEHPYSDGKVLMATGPHATSIVDMRNQLTAALEKASRIAP